MRNVDGPESFEQERETAFVLTNSIHHEFCPLDLKGRRTSIRMVSISAKRIQCFSLNDY